jgi:hypothetical protein
MQCGCAILTSAACPDLQIFWLYPINCTIFEKKFEHKMCFAIFSTTFVWKTSHTKTKRMIKNVYSLHVKYPLFLSDFSETWIFSAYFWKIIKYQILWNLSSRSQVVPCGYMDKWTDGQTDMTKLKITFEILHLRLKRINIFNNICW